jgi:uncharacterized lipoprotein YmbA
MMRTPFPIRVVACLAVLALGACGTAPKESFYTLNPATSPVSAQDRSAAAYSVAVSTVRVPEIVDRPQLVVRDGANRVDILELHRWAQPLRAEIAQTLATGLAASLPQARVLLDRDTASQDADYRISLDVRRFEAVPGQTATVQSTWTIRAAGAGPATIGQSAIREAVNGQGYDAVAAAFSRAIMQTAGDIAGAVASLRAAHGGSAEPARRFDK